MIPEYCGNGHLRTPATTYVPPSGKRQCRVCSGKMPPNTKDGIDLRGYHGQVFTPKQLEQLRFLVRCLGCDAVPHETGVTREVKNQHGESVSLPVVVTEHAEGCPVAAQSPRRGRPRKKVSKHEQRPCGDCHTCGTPMLSSFGRPKKYCDDVCRSKAKRARLKKAATS